MSENRVLDGYQITAKIDELEEKLSELEKKVDDSLLLPTIVQHGSDHTRIDDKIAEQKEELGNIKTNRNILEIHRHDLDELKERFKRIENEVFDSSNQSRIDEALGDCHAIEHDLVPWKEVLREIMKVIENQFDYGQYDKLLAKLDGTEEEMADWILDQSCDIKTEKNDEKPPERFMVHITHCPHCDGIVEVECHESEKSCLKCGNKKQPESYWKLKDGYRFEKQYTQEYLDVKTKEIEERVRDATRKELISDFVEKISKPLELLSENNPYYYATAFINDIIKIKKEYEAMLK